MYRVIILLSATVYSSWAVHVLFSDVRGHYFKDHHSYFLFGCLCYIPRILLGLSCTVYWGPCKVHMQCLLHAVGKV